MNNYPPTNVPGTPVLNTHSYYEYKFITDPSEVSTQAQQQALHPFIPTKTSVKKFLDFYFKDKTNLSTIMMLLYMSHSDDSDSIPLSLYVLNQKKINTHLPFEYIRKDFKHLTPTKGIALETWGWFILANELDNAIFTGNPIKIGFWLHHPVSRMLTTFTHFYECMTKSPGEPAFSLYARLGCSPKYTQHQSIVRYKLFSRYCDDPDNVPWGITTLDAYNLFLRYMQIYNDLTLNAEVIIEGNKNTKFKYIEKQMHYYYK